MEENKQEVVQETSQQTTQEVKQAEVVQNNGTTVQKKTNPSALASFICSLVGLLVAGLPLGIAAIITGVTGISTFKPETETNKWMAITGLCLGIVDVICVVIYLSTMQSLF